jgi:hypothetical protein
LEQERGNPRYALIVDTRAVLLESACVFHLFQNARYRGYYTAARRFLSSSGENNILRTSAASE